MKSSVKILRGQIENVFKEYDDIDALTDDQANQSSNRIYKVIDASDDPNLTFPSGETKLHAYYEYKETPNSDIEDYDLIGAPFADGGSGGGVPREEEIVGTRRDESSLIGTLTLDWNLFKVYAIGITGSTSLVDDNLPTGADTKVMEVLVWGNASLTLPSYWTPFPNNDDYDGSMLNHIVITCIDGDTPKKVFYSLQNIILNE